MLKLISQQGLAAIEIEWDYLKYEFECHSFLLTNFSLLRGFGANSRLLAEQTIN